MHFRRKKQPKQTWQQRAAEQAAAERNTLEAIGSVTDPLAAEALSRLDILPQNERELFIRNVLRQLTLQAIATALPIDSSPAKMSATANEMTVNTLHYFGKGHSMWVIPGELMGVVVSDSVPVFVQPALELPPLQ